MEAYLGTIQAFAFPFAPSGWMLCQGQLVPIQVNTALFSLLGTYFGGNGTTNFQLPDLRGRAPIGQGQGNGLSNYVIGEVGGAEQVTLNQLQLPQHTHQATATSTSTSQSTSTLNAEKGNGTGVLPANHLLSGAGQGNQIYAPFTDGQTVAMASQAVATTTTTTTNTTVAVSPAGGSQPVSVQQPYLCINYCICVNGLFPSRN